MHDATLALRRQQSFLKLAYLKADMIVMIKKGNRYYLRVSQVDGI
jgi:hypothetical protein